METWIILLFSLCISAVLKSLLSHVISCKKVKHSIPPGPPAIPVTGNPFLQSKFFPEIEPILKKLLPKYGPIFTLHIGKHPCTFVANHSLAHQSLVQSSTIFSDRPKAIAATGGQHNIFSASYGPTWRVLRRNLTSEMLSPSRIRSHSHARTWVLDILINRLEFNSRNGDPVLLADHFDLAIFSLSTFMCFGAKLAEQEINQIKEIGQSLLSSLRGLNVLNIWPTITKILFRKRLQHFLQIQKDERDIFMPLIRARQCINQENNEDQHVLCYADTLLNLELPDEKRKLNDDEIVSLSSEFLNGVCDTTSTELQWIMANLIKHPHIQEKLYKEIIEVIGEAKEIKETDLQKMKYLKATILEGLRRHPPVHFLVPHAVAQDTELGGYLLPKNSTINFMIAEMGMDPNVWDEPTAFKPERFLSGDNGKVEVFDVTGRKEIKMMPFGVGRRICPGFNLAMFHLEYFVANLVWKFRWSALEGGEVDLTEKIAFTVEMKIPLVAHIQPRGHDI